MLKRNIRSVFITLSNTSKMEWFLRNIETLQLDVYSKLFLKNSSGLRDTYLNTTMSKSIIDVKMRVSFI